MISEGFAALFDFWHERISVFLPRVCRYEPTCSVYGSQALRKYGLFKGLRLAVKRVLSCHPWSRGGYDPLN